MGSKDEERAARLKAALRDNLKRRKAQARGRADEAAPSPATGREDGGDTKPDARPATAS